MMKKYMLFVLFLISGLLNGKTQEVSVTITTDEWYTKGRSVIDKMEYNLSKVLSEINRAQRENRPLNIVGLDLDAFARDALTMLWANVHFYCDDTEVVERCWVFDDGKEYMVSHIPLIIEVEGESFGNGVYQEAVVDFDASGRITDFRFSLDAQLSESMKNCGSVVDAERRIRILAYCERFRTAYNTKDMPFLEQVFSDDALIITGKVGMVKAPDSPYSTMKVTYKKQTKQEYLTNLKRAFMRNKWIDVKFSEIGEHGEEGGCAGITRSKVNPNMYGVRLFQEWKSSNYSDTGYLFLLWDFADEDKPVIHVRTWQPDWVGGVRQQPDDDISTLGAFDL